MNASSRPSPPGRRGPAVRVLGVLLAAACSIATARAGEEAAARSRAFVAAHPVWRVSGDPAWRPYSFRAADGRIVGLDVEFSRLLAERIGVRIDWVDVPDWPEALRRYRSGEVDLLMGTARTPERDREMIFTAPYAASPVAVIARLDFPFLVTLRDLAGQTVAAPEGHVTTDYLRRLRPDFRIVAYPDLDAAVRAVADGDADAMVAGLIPAATTVRALGLENLKVAGLVDARFDLCVAVRPDWPIARDLLDEAIAADPPEVRIERFDRWLAPIMGLQRQAWRWRSLFLAGLAVAGSLVVCLLVVIVWNRVLKARVARATAAIRAEMAAHAESETRFRTIFEQAPLGMYRSTPGGVFLSVNAFLARLFEYDSAEQMISEVNRTGIAEALFDDPRQRTRVVSAVLANPGGLVVSDVRYRTRTGRRIETLLSMAAIDDPVSGDRTLIGFVQDVTERVRDEATRRQREKLLALGQMASGVAHDFNNLLCVVLSEAELLAAERGGDPAVGDPARRILEAVAGARALTGRLLRFVRSREGAAPSVYDVHAAVRAAVELFRTAGCRGIRVAQDLGAASTRVTGFQGELQNAVLNLCLNARDAMAEEGTLTLRTRDVVLSPAECAALAPYKVAPGPHLEIEVSDTGSGMTEEVLASCRDPFFTTKGEDGTGLGLWMVHCVVAGHGGGMRIASRVRAGTTVTIDVPLAAADAAVRPSSA